MKDRDPIGFAAVALLIGLCATTLAAPSWEATLTNDPSGSFPEPRAVETTYHFGWSGLTAGKGDIRLSKVGGKRFQLEATGGTTGFVRALWKLDATYRGFANAETLRRLKANKSKLIAEKKSRPSSPSPIPA